MKIIKWPKWFIILNILFCIGFFIYHYESTDSFFRKKFNKDIAKNLKGIVIKKFIDKEEHLLETCIIKSENEYERFIFDLDKSGVFDYVQVGDSIYKPKGDSTIVIIRDKQISHFTLEY